MTDDLARKLLDASPDGLLLVDAAGVIRLANQEACALFGIGESEFVGTVVEELLPDEQRPSHVGLRRRYSANPRRRPMGSELRLEGQRRDGTRFPAEVSLSPVEIGDETFTVAAVRDVTERQQTLARVTVLRDRERIARDIHDMVIQRLFAAGMSLQGIDGLIESPVARDRLAGVIDELDETIRQLRNSIFELGQVDDPQSLSSQLAAIVSERARHLRFTPVVHIDGDLDDLAPIVAEQLVATLTEALSNVARHADATEARVDVIRSDERVELRVTDNGVGIGAVPKRRGGLSNMMWRAAGLGGSCSVSPAEPKGTVLDWRVPLDRLSI